MNKSTIAIVAVVALLLGIALSSTLHRSQAPQLETLRWLGEQSRPLPEFELADHRGGIVNRESMQGQWSLLFFGYTHCPDICPGSMQVMDQVLASVKPEVANRLQVYFVSVDPYRDTPEKLASYVNYFNEQITGATASEDNLRVLTGNLGILHKVHRQSEADLDYPVDHSAHFILVNPQVQFSGLVAPPHDASLIAEDLNRIIDYY